MWVVQVIRSLTVIVVFVTPAADTPKRARRTKDRSIYGDSFLQKLTIASNKTIEPWTD